MEKELIDHLQKFLLELGRGYSFVARQNHFNADGRHFQRQMYSFLSCVERGLKQDRRTVPCLPFYFSYKAVMFKLVFLLHLTQKIFV